MQSILLKSVSLLGAFLLSEISFAQSVTVANSTSCNGSYTTLKGACDCLNGTSQTGNNVTISIGGNTTETATVSITGAAGMWNSLTISPSGGAARTVSGAIAGQLISLSAASKVVIDGLNTGGNSLTIENTNTGTTTSTVAFVNNAQTDTLRNLTLNGSTTGSSYGVILVNNSNSGSGNDNCGISNCLIGPAGSNLPSNGLSALGTAATTDNWTISGCSFFDNFLAASSHSGIHVAVNSISGWTISGNSFYQTATRNITAGIEMVGIRIEATSGNGFTISNNYVGGQEANCGGSAMTYTGSGIFRGILLSTGTTTTSNVQGNTIQNISITSSSGSSVQSGISLVSGAFNCGTTASNLVGKTGTTNSIAYNCSNSGTFTGILAGTGTPGNITIKSNTITGIAVTGTTSILRGISVQGSAGVIDVDGNNIGEAGVSNALNNSTNTVLTGIHASNSGGRNYIRNNIIAGLTSTGTSNVQTQGIVTSGTGKYSIKSNQISEFYSTSTYAGTTANSCLMGISVTNTSTDDTISSNIVHSLYNTAASANITVTGIYINTNTTGSVVSENMVHSFSSVSSGTGVIHHGILIGSSTSNSVILSNNFVRMGILPAGSDFDVNSTVYGILESAGSNKFYHNTVWVGGGVNYTGTRASYAFASSVTASNVREVKNNIFVNNRYNNSGTGVHTVYQVSSTNPSGLSSDYNIFYSNSIGSGGNLFRFASTNSTTIKSFRETMYNNTTPITNDLHSGVGNPNLVSPDNSIYGIDLHIQSTTPADAMGVSVSSVTTDYDGDTRSSITPTDIGADAGSFGFATSDDIFTPTFSYTAATSSSLTSSRTIASVTITDQGNGIVMNTSGNAPRVWWRRKYPSTSSWYNGVGTYVSGNGNSSVWNFTIDYAGNSFTPTVNDSIQYYFVAQDSVTGNIWYSTFYGTSHTSVSAQTSAPVIYQAYRILNGVSGSYNVGTGQTYTTLTGSGGFFEYVNNGTVTGNVVVNIMSDITEPGTNALNEFIDEGGGHSTMLIQSTSSLRILSATGLSQSMIRLSGADRVTFDGTSSKFLLFRNTHTTASSCYSAIEFSGTAERDTVRNCIMESNTQNTIHGTVQVSSTVNTNPICFISCTFRNATGGTTGKPYNGVIVRLSSKVMFYYNEVHNFSNNGIYLFGAANGCYIYGNSFYMTDSVSVSSCKMLFLEAGDSHVVHSNYFGGQQANAGGSMMQGSSITNSLICIYNNTLASTYRIHIYNNTIRNIRMNCITSNTFYGIFSVGGSYIGSSGNGNTIGSTTTANSIIVGNNSSGNMFFYGIYLAGTASIQYNVISHCTVDLSGNKGDAYVIYSPSTCQVDLVNNNQVSEIKAGKLISGIQLTSTSTCYVYSNMVFGLRCISTTSICSVYAIKMACSSSLFVYGNRIFSLSIAYSNASCLLTGIDVDVADNACKIYNNQVSIVNLGYSGSCMYRGIYAVSNRTLKLLYNTIYIGGSQNNNHENEVTCAYLSGDSLYSYNNIFYNKHSYTYTLTPPPVSACSWNSNNVTSNYNAIFTRGTYYDFMEGGLNYSFLGWKDSIYEDKASWMGHVDTVYEDSLFMDVDTGDLSIRTDRTYCWWFKGKGIGGNASCTTASDYYGNTRNNVFGYGTCIGSHEFTPASNPPSATASAAPANNSTTYYTFGRRTIGTISWGPNGTVPSSVNVQYFSGITPPNPTQGGARPNAKYMDCYWQCQPTGGSGYTCDINLYYDSALIGSLNYGSERRLKMAKRPDVSSSNWGLAANAAVDTLNNYISGTGFTSFSIFAASDSGDAAFDALPLRLLSFDATKNGNDVALAWNTASEENVELFEVEYSSDGVHFAKVGEKYAAGTNGIAQYTYLHQSAFGGHLSRLYYRLRITESGGGQSVSAVRMVSDAPELFNCVITTGGQLTVFCKEPLQLNLISVEGKALMQHTVSNVQQTIDLSSLPAGVYILSANGAGGNHTIRFVKP